jgi:hypothetical protein
MVFSGFHDFHGIQTEVSRFSKSKVRRQVHVTDDMILPLVRACVRASRQRSGNKQGEQLSPELEEQEAALRLIP